MMPLADAMLPNPYQQGVFAATWEKKQAESEGIVGCLWPCLHWFWVQLSPFSVSASLLLVSLCLFAQCL